MNLLYKFVLKTQITVIIKREKIVRKRREKGDKTFVCRVCYNTLAAGGNPQNLRFRKKRRSGGAVDSRERHDTPSAQKGEKNEDIHSERE